MFKLPPVENWEPYRVTMLAEMLIIGLGTLVFFGDISTRAIRSFPAPLGHVFAFGMALSAGVALFGIARGRTVEGVLYEQWAQLGLAVLLGLYGAASATLYGKAGTAFAVMIFSRFVAATLRFVQIKLLRRRAVRHGTT